MAGENIGKIPWNKGKSFDDIVRQKMSMPLAVFQTTEAKKRSQLYAKTPAFHVGEKTTMSLTWFGIKAGEITLEVRDNVAVGGRDAYHFVGTAKSSATMDLIHSVDDSIESYVDKETFYPLKSELHGVETDRLRETRMLFDYSRQNIHYWMKRVHVKKGTKEEKRVDPITPGTLDIFTSGFFLRAQQLEVGNVYHSDLYNEGKHITVKAKVLRRETLETEIGRFQTLVVQPEARFEGILKMSGDSLIWVTDDPRHFVLQVETKIKIGYLKLNVLKIEDPTYGFPSRIEKES